jgi:hypothetical protein
LTSTSRKPASISELRTQELESAFRAEIQSRPGLKFGELVGGVQRTQRLSRRTIARHLSRLVRFGDVTLLADHSYALGSQGEHAISAEVEYRWEDYTDVIHPDGSALMCSEKEFRMVSGQLDRLEFPLYKPPRLFHWWCTAGGKVSRLPAARSPNSMELYRIEFPTPLTPRDGGWHRYKLSMEFHGIHQMASSPPRASVRRGARAAPPSHSFSATVRSENRTSRIRLSSNAHLRLAVVFPHGYPVDWVRPAIRFGSELGPRDSIEERRVVNLGEEERHSEGLHRTANMVTLSVPRPQMGRNYQIEWALPSVARRDRWLRTVPNPGRRMKSGPSTPPRRSLRRAPRG